MSIVLTALMLAGTAAFVNGQAVGNSNVAAQLPGRVLPDADEPIKPIADPAASHDKRMNRIWLGSIAMVLAGTTADAITSGHKQEANGFLASSNGTFGGKAIGIKVGISAAVLLPQIILRHHTEMRKAFIIGNVIDAGVFGATAIHNAGVKAP